MYYQMLKLLKKYIAIANELAHSVTAEKLK